MNRSKMIEKNIFIVIYYFKKAHGPIRITIRSKSKLGSLIFVLKMGDPYFDRSANTSLNHY